MEWNKTWVRLAATLSSIMALKWRPPKILRSRKDLNDILNFKYQNVFWHIVLAKWCIKLSRVQHCKRNRKKGRSITSVHNIDNATFYDLTWH